MIYFDYWLWSGCFYLVILAFLDVRKKMVFDARYNYIMVGLTFSLLSHKSLSFWYLLALVVLSLFVFFLFKKFSVFGFADVVAFLWIFLGFGIIQPGFMLLFIALVVVFGAFYRWVGLRLKLSRVPFIPVIAVSFIICALMI